MGMASQMSDEHLLERMRAGELALYGVLIRRHHRHFHSVARRILRNDAEAEDAVQQAHLRALTRLDQFGGRSSFVTYLTRIVINEALSRIRARPHFPVLDLASVPLENNLLFVSHGRDPEAQVFDRELSAALHAALEGLPEMYRLVFRMRELDEMSVAEAAARLGITDECVKTRLHRARLLLRRDVRRRIGSDRPWASRPPLKRHGSGRARS